MAPVRFHGWAILRPWFIAFVFIGGGGMGFLVLVEGCGGACCVGGGPGARVGHFAIAFCGRLRSYWSRVLVLSTWVADEFLSGWATRAATRIYDTYK